MRRALPFALLLAACTTDFALVAQETFEVEHSCPAARLEVRAHPELAWVDVLDADSPSAAPPPEVAADAGRLAIWSREQAKLRASRAKSYARHVVVEVRGCGYRELYGCEPGYQELEASCDGATDAARDAVLGRAP
jgi:hypothetical protein